VSIIRFLKGPRDALLNHEKVKNYLRMILQEESASTAFPAREIAPPSHQRWVEEKKDEFSALKERFREWTASTEEHEELFRRFVYESKRAFDGDFRQHRMCLCCLMSEGEEIAYDFLVYLEKQPSEEGASYVAIIDQKVSDLRTTFFKWHAGVEAQADLPESLKEAAREIEAGQVEDWEDL